MIVSDEDTLSTSWSGQVMPQMTLWLKDFYKKIDKQKHHFPSLMLYQSRLFNFIELFFIDVKRCKLLWFTAGH